MTNITPWGANEKLFNTHLAHNENGIDLSKLQFGVAANIAVAWRGVSDLLDAERQRLGRPLHVLDFGCGAGGFAESIDDRGDVVVGIDASPEMIANARAHIQSVSRQYFIYHLTGTEESIRYFPRRDAIVANLVTNYLLSGVDSFAHYASRALEPGGVVLFSELNPIYVRECLKRGIIYTEPNPIDDPKYATLNFSSGAKRIRIWEQSDHEATFAQFGMTLCAWSAPPLTEEFFNLFPNQIDEKYPRDIPRYRIYGFRKDVR